MKTRIEVNEFGDYFTVIPYDIMEELELEEGEQFEWDSSDNGSVLLSVV